MNQGMYTYICIYIYINIYIYPWIRKTSRQLRVKKHKSVETAFIKNETKLGHVDGQ